MRITNFMMCSGFSQSAKKKFQVSIFSMKDIAGPVTKIVFGYLRLILQIRGYEKLYIAVTTNAIPASLQQDKLHCVHKTDY
jgi:hypothetical protein